MRKAIFKIDKEFRKHWKSYVLQSFLASVVIFIVIMTLSIQENPVIIASIGATTFIVFAMPNNLTAQTKNIIGGHLAGLACGFVCHFILHPAFIPSVTAQSFLYALAVGLSIFVMVTIDTEHPPASGTALGAAISGFSWNITITVIVSVVVLSLIHRFFKKHLRDLT
ncbi:HPP family protein [Planctomycetota bacterium]